MNMHIHLPANWWLTYLGKPWAVDPNPPASYNCGELVRAVHRDLCGIDSPAIPVADAGSRLQCVRAMRPELFGLEALLAGAAPRALDVAFLGGPLRPGRGNRRGPARAPLPGSGLRRGPGQSHGTARGGFPVCTLVPAPEHGRGIEVQGVGA